MGQITHRSPHTNVRSPPCVTGPLCTCRASLHARAWSNADLCGLHRCGKNDACLLLELHSCSLSHTHTHTHTHTYIHTHTHTHTHSSGTVISGGQKPGPSYEEVCMGMTGHTEAVRVTYDPTGRQNVLHGRSDPCPPVSNPPVFLPSPAECSYDMLLDVYFKHTDPTTPNRQGNDVGKHLEPRTQPYIREHPLCTPPKRRYSYRHHKFK